MGGVKLEEGAEKIQILKVEIDKQKKIVEQKKVEMESLLQQIT